MNKTNTRRAFFLSLVSLMLCFTMMLGTTFAWFTDSVNVANNRIVAGNLDVELFYDNASTTGFENVTKANAKMFVGTDGEEILWEPGAVAYTNFEIRNVGNLALKYAMNVVVTDETTTTVDGEVLSLEDVIKVAVLPGETVDNREAAIAKANASGIKFSEIATNGDLLPTGEVDDCAVILYWAPNADDVDNKYNLNNDRQGDDALDITFDIRLTATQLTHEEDSFGPDYDVDAPVLTYEVTPETIQDYLDGKYGSTTNMKLVLTEGDYDTLYLGRPTKYEGSTTTYICGSDNFETTDAEAFKAHVDDGAWHTTPKYVTSVDNLQIVAEDGANVTVAGVKATTGHAYGDVYDYVRDKDYDAGSAYYSTLYMKNVKFTDITFDAPSDINTSDADTVIDGVTFDNCSFIDSSASNKAAIRYYNEANNGNVKNLTVSCCDFTGWYQGIYTHHVNGITVTENTFDTIDHNAVALQGYAGAVNHGEVNISYNTFTNVNNRIIRLNEVGSGSKFTIKYNIARDSGDGAGEVIKATSLANDVVYDVNYNSWGDSAVIANDQFKDADANAVTSAINSAELAAAVSGGDKTVVLSEGKYEFPTIPTGTTIIGQHGVVFEDTLSGTLDDVTLKNIHIKDSNAQRWAYSKGTLVFEDCTFEATGVYAIHYDGLNNANITYKNCTIIGWAAIGSGAAHVTFDGCKIYGNGTYGVLRLYSPATIKNCTFDVADVNTTDVYQDGIHAVDCEIKVSGNTNVNGNMSDIYKTSGTGVITEA